MNRKERLKEEQEGLFSAWHLRNKKLGRLHQDLAVETDTAKKFQLELQIEAEETAIKPLAKRLDEIEQDLNSSL